MGHALSLDDSISQESQFIDIPAGFYDADIDHTEIDKCQWTNEYNGQNMLVVYINISTPEGDGQLRDNIVLNSDFEWKLSQLFLATGQKKHGEDLENLGRAIKDLPGMPVRVEVVKKPGKGDNADTLYSNIKRYIEPKKKPTPQNTGWKGGF